MKYNIKSEHDSMGIVYKLTKHIIFLYINAYCKSNQSKILEYKISEREHKMIVSIETFPKYDFKF